MSSSTAATHRRSRDEPTADRPTPRAPRLPVLRWAAQVVVWIVILVSLGALAAGVLVPRLGGATPYTVLTGSMRPTLPPGTLVVMKPVEGTGQVGIGTVVTYQLRSDEPTVVTHRVVATRTDLRGNLEYQTRGDANGAPDQRWVRPVQVRGQLWYAVPKLGLVNQWLTGHQRGAAILVVAGGLALYAGTMFAGAVRDRRRRKEPT